MGSLSKMTISLGSLTHIPEITQVFSSYLSNLSLFLAFFLLTSQTHSSLKAEAELFAIPLYDNFPFSSLLSLHYYLLLPYFFVYPSWTIAKCSSIAFSRIFVFTAVATNCIFIFVVPCEIWSQKVEYDMVSFVKHSEYII